MFLGALLELGLSESYLLNELQKLNIIIPKIEIRKVVKKGIAATLVDVEEVVEHHHRHLEDIKEIILHSKLNLEVQKKAIECFTNLAVAEAKVHGVNVNEIHFHEVGALDAIVDIVGACIGWDYLKIDRVVVSPIRLGSGTIKCAHGDINLPAPATVELLQGFEAFGGHLKGEWTTPTGAVIIKTLGSQQGPMPSMKINKVGWGAGSNDREIPNALRIIVGEMETLSHDMSVMLETNIDDMNPELYGNLGELLLENGAKDFYFAPIFMKKNRPGVLVSVIASVETAEILERVLLTETTTLGVRRYTVERKCLERGQMVVSVNEQPVRIKTALQNGKILKFSPEYEDCRTIARQCKSPVQEIFNTACYEAKHMIDKME